MPHTNDLAPVTANKYLNLPGQADPKPDTAAAAYYYADKFFWDPVPLWPIGGHGECLCPYPWCPPTSAGKHPMPKEWQNWSRRTPEQVRECWLPKNNTARVTPGVGLNLGAGNLLVVDLDSRDAVIEWFRGPFQNYRTLTAKTGRGLHLFYQQDDERHLLRSVGQGSITKAHGLHGTEIRGVGSFVVAPPSMHRSGVRYTWLELVAPLTLPDDLREWIEKAGGRAQVRRRPPSVSPSRREHAQHNSGPGGLPRSTSPARGAVGVVTVNMLWRLLQARCDELGRMAPESGRNNMLNSIAFVQGADLLLAGASRVEVESVLMSAARACECPGAASTVRSGLEAGIAERPMGGRSA